MSNGRFVVLLLLASNTLALVAQVLIDFSTVNLASACVVYASSVAVLLYLLWTPAIYTHPMSTYAILGFCVTTQMGALLVQTAYGISIALNLRQPIETFLTLAFFQMLALLAHVIYRTLLSPNISSFSRARPGFFGLPRLLLEKLGLYQVPSTKVLWTMGYIGLFSLIAGGGRDGIFFKILDGVGFLAWAPYLIPMYVLFQGPTYCNPKKQYPHLFIFMCLVVLIGLAANARSVMLSGFVTIALFGFLLVLRSTQKVRWNQVFRVAILGSLLLIVSIPLSDLATAMVVARKVRGAVSAPQMVSETFRYFAQPEALQAERDKQVTATLTGYDEFYVVNPLLARFVETKFHDNAFFFAGTLTQTDSKYLSDVSLKMVGVLLPQPFIDTLGWRIDKLDYKFTIGDYLSYLSTGAPLGGYKTGSALAHAIGVFGAGAAVVYLFACLLAFAILDLLAHPGRSGEMVLSAVAMLSVWKIFQWGITAESLHNWFGYFVRALPQNTAIFLAFAFLARVPGLLFGGGKRHQAPNPPLPG